MQHIKGATTFVYISFNYYSTILCNEIILSETLFIYLYTISTSMSLETLENTKKKPPHKNQKVHNLLNKLVV